MLRKILRVLLLIIVLVVLIYQLGPKVEKPILDGELPVVTSDLMVLEREINQREAAISNLKENNQARIVWFDSIPRKTKYSLVYLHGWSASQEEGAPLHRETAKRYGCNLYLSRLAGHGLQEKEAMLTLTADQLLDSAKEAIAIGKQLGEKVILMATSTGGTLALYLAGKDPDIDGLILYSPNIEIYDSTAKFLDDPWGLQIAKLVKGSDYHEYEANSPEKEQYWVTKYRLESLTQLQALMEETMTQETFASVEQPVFVGYFYKNDSIQDKVVSVPAILEMYEALGTAKANKRKVAFPEAGDHVLASYVVSKDLESVRDETFSFLEEIVGLKTVVPPTLNRVSDTLQLVVE